MHAVNHKQRDLIETALFNAAVSMEEKNEKLSTLPESICVASGDCSEAPEWRPHIHTSRGVVYYHVLPVSAQQ